MSEELLPLLTAAIDRLTDNAKVVKKLIAEKGLDHEDTYKASLELEQAMLLWRIRRTRWLRLVEGRNIELLAIERAIISLEGLR